MSAIGAIQKEILSKSNSSKFKDFALNILDLKSISKLKIVALLERNKARNLFDLGEIINQNILTIKEILDLSNQSKDIKNSVLISSKVTIKGLRSVYHDDKHYY
jgi:hypothetical protein